jgi:hypothetical protein
MAVISCRISDMGKPRLNLRLREDLHRKLEEATRRPGVTKNALIEQALQEYFEPATRHCSPGWKRLRSGRERSRGMSRCCWRRLDSSFSTGSPAPIRSRKGNGRSHMPWGRGGLIILFSRSPGGPYLGIVFPTGSLIRRLNISRHFDCRVQFPAAAEATVSLLLPVGARGAQCRGHWRWQ